jgi:hypothetical protein
MRLHQLSIYCIGVYALASSAIAFDYPKDAVIYDGAAGSTKIKITGSARPFSRASHKTKDFQPVGVAGHENGRCATVDGQPVVGTDQTLPKDGIPQLAALTVWFGETKVSVPDKHLHHVFLPSLRPATFEREFIDTLVSVSADGKAVYLSLAVGDGGGAGTYGLVIRADGTIISGSIRRPEP